MFKFLRFPLILLAILWSIAIAPQRAGAAPPFDHRSLAPNHTSELPGAGYLLTDPFQGASRAYWAGAYRTIAGQRSYCIDDYYDYPDPRYGYRTGEAGSWAGRPGSNRGASGRTAQRIAWIVNRYGSSAAPATDAAVSMAINLLMGSAPFNRSYFGYFRPQLDAIDRSIVPSIDRMISESARWAGPYRAEVRMGPAPALGGEGTFTVLIRSAAGYSVPWSEFSLRPSAGMNLVGSPHGTTGHTGVVTYRYHAARAGVLSVSVTGLALPNNTIRIGYSPTHASNNFSTGSQRVALVSGRRLVNTAPGRGQVHVNGPIVRTVVDGGSSARTPGQLVSDHVMASRLAPRTSYRLTFALRDDSGQVCGRQVVTVVTDARGILDRHTGRLPVCGGGRNTFYERLSQGTLTIATTPPGLPPETFPVQPVISTQVVGGTGGRRPGTQVADRVTAAGLIPGSTGTILAVLTDASGRVCGHTSTAVTVDQAGRVALTTAPLPVCGTGRDTFVEQFLNTHGTVLVASGPNQASETFVVTPPPSSPPSPTPPSSRPPAPHSPTPRPPTPVPTPPSSPHPTPHLALTGDQSRLALATGLLSVALGGFALVGSRRR